MESKRKDYKNFLRGSHQKLHMNVFRIYGMSSNILGINAFTMAFNLLREKAQDSVLRNMCIFLRRNSVSICTRGH